MSVVMNLAPLAEMTLVKSNLATHMFAAGVATAPGSLMRSPSTVNCDLFFSFFSGYTLHTNDLYVTSFLRSLGMSSLSMNWIVLVGFFTLFPAPLAKRPNSFAEY